MNQDRLLVDKIKSMTITEQETYFLSLSDVQRDYVRNLMFEYSRPNQLCEIDDSSASFSDWILSHFYVPELNGPIWLADYQIQALNEATKKNKDGLYKYSLVAWLDIKKSIKSCIAAAVALRMAFMREWSSIKVVANKREQAQSRSYFYITRSLKLNPQTAQMLDEGLIRINNYTINFYFNNSTIKAIPLNPEGEAGGNDDLIIWTEAWAAKTKAAQTMFTEMVIPPNKFGRGFKWLESYAGYSGASPILEPIYFENVKPKHRVKNTDMYSNERTFVLCNHTPKLPWQSRGYYAQQAKELDDSEFRRVHKNEWVSSQDRFINGVQWQHCQTKLPSLKLKEKLILAVDVGLSDDHFVLIGVNKVRGKVAVRVVKQWIPQKGKKLSFSNPNPKDKQSDVEYPVGFIKMLAQKYKILVVRYDPYQAEKLAEDMMTERVCYWESFSQQSEREKSDSYLYSLIRDDEIFHNGNSELTQHIQNADAQHKGENKLRIVKRSQSLKIDLAVALSMAAYTVKDYNI